MTELNRSELPINRDTKNLFTKNPFNFSNDRPQKFLVLTILAYFGTKIFNNFFNVYSVKNNTEETLDLLSTIVLSAVLFYLTGLNSRPTMGEGFQVNKFFFMGLIVGTSMSIFEYKVINPMRKDNHGKYMSLRILMVALCIFVVMFNIFISTTVSAQNYPSSLNYLIYIFVIIAVLTALYFSKTTNVVCRGKDCPPDIPIDPPSKPTCNSTSTSDDEHATVMSLKTSQFNISVGLVAWLMATTFIYDSNNEVYNAILSTLFGFFVGTYISNFSTFGIQYTVQSDTSINDTTPITPSQLTSAFESLGINAQEKYNLFNTIDGKKYKKRIDEACKISINDEFVIDSKNSRTKHVYNCVKDSVVKDGKYTITFYKDEISQVKIFILIIAVILLVAVITYILNLLIPLIQI